MGKAAGQRKPRQIGREARLLLAHPLGWVACGAGSGLSPLASGTTGSAALVLLYLLLGAQTWPWWWHLLPVLGLLALGVWASSFAIRVLAEDDAAAIVIDEWQGQWTTLAIGLATWPVGDGGWTLVLYLTLGFLLFRLADIAKPWPARSIDRRLGGGWGAMLDDAVAGIYAGLALAAVGWWM